MNKDNHPMKQAVIAPSMLYLLYPLDSTVEGYTKEEFVNDLINEVRSLPISQRSFTHAVPRP